MLAGETSGEMCGLISPCISQSPIPAELAGNEIIGVPYRSYQDSLLCYLPQTKIYGELDRELEFSDDLIPEYMVTGHETCTGTSMRIDPEHMRMYDLVREHPEIFPGFLHYDIRNNILPKLEILRDLGCYSSITAK